MLQAIASCRYHRCRGWNRTVILTVGLWIGAIACSSTNTAKSELENPQLYQFVIASDSPGSGYVPGVIKTTGETIYISTDSSDRIAKFDSLVPSLTASGLHISAWLPSESLNSLSDLTQKHVGRRLAFQLFGEVLNAAHINRALQFTGPVSIGIATDSSNARRLLHIIPKK